MQENSFIWRLTAAIEHAGGDHELARKAGISAKSLWNYKNGKTEPKGEMIAKIAAAAGVRPEWLFAGKPPMIDEPPASALKAEQPRPGYAYIPLYNVAAGASNNGRTVHEERAVDVLAFKEDWIRQEVRARPSDLRLIYVEGDSMEPDLRAGDIVMLDHTDTLAKREGIYVIKMDGALLVKSLQRLPGGIVKVISRNQAYEPFTVTVSEVENPNGFAVIGRVVWACRRF